MTIPNGASYAAEKLRLAEYQLAVGPGDARSRIRSVCGLLVAVGVSDFPEELQKDYAWILHELTKREAVVGEGRFNATIDKMRNATAAKIAAKIVEASSALDGYLDDAEKE